MLYAVSFLHTVVQVGLFALSGQKTCIWVLQESESLSETNVVCRVVPTYSGSGWSVCPALVRKLVLGFCKKVKASQNCIVQAICDSDIW